MVSWCWHPRSMKQGLLLHQSKTITRLWTLDGKTSTRGLVTTPDWPRPPLHCCSSNSAASFVHLPHCWTNAPGLWVVVGICWLLRRTNRNNNRLFFFPLVLLLLVVVVIIIIAMAHTHSTYYTPTAALNCQYVGICGTQTHSHSNNSSLPPTSQTMISDSIGRPHEVMFFFGFLPTSWESSSLPTFDVSLIAITWPLL